MTVLLFVFMIIKRWIPSGFCVILNTILLLAKWKALDTAGIPMYIGLAAYRVGEVSKTDLGWSLRSDNLSSQITALRNAGCQGYMIYNYSSMVSPTCATEMQGVRQVNGK